jgi:hypothetical protein
LALLVHRVLRGQVMGHHPPCGTRLHNPAQAIEDLAQAVRTLGSVCRVMRAT